MANTVNITTKLSISDALGSKAVERTFSLAPTGTRYFANREVVGTTAAAMSIAGCQDLRYAAIVNPSDSGATVTVTMAAIVLKPGDPAIFPPGTSLVTLQSTGASTEIAIAGTEA